jgi:hypothetical protein
MTPLPALDETRASRWSVPTAEMLQLATAGGPGEVPLRQTQWSQDICRRLDAIADSKVRACLTDALRTLLHTAGDHPVLIGHWHGDWTPWNMSCVQGRVALWDWEHFADEVPLGFDALHYRAQDLRTSMLTRRAAERAWLAEVRTLLAPFGQGPDMEQAVTVAYLLDINLRFLLDHHQGTSVVRRQGWGLDMLHAEVGRLHEKRRAW